jgi:hypothetical protein
LSSPSHATSAAGASCADTVNSFGATASPWPVALRIASLRVQ